MELFYTFFTIFTIIDLLSVIKRKVKRDIIVYVILSLIVLAFSIFYYKDTTQNSMICIIHKLLGIKVK